MFVDRMAAHIHAGEGADDRDRQGEGGDQRRPEATQEEIDGDDDQQARQGKGELDVFDSVADRDGAVRSAR